MRIPRAGVLCALAAVLTMSCFSLLAQGPLTGSGNAPIPTVVTTTVDYTTNLITIIGSNFGTTKPVVTLDSLTLAVNTYTDTNVVAVLPLTIKPGSYTLQLTNTSINKSGGFDTTIGAVGPMGPQGVPGAAGAPGATGLQGPKGDPGATGPTGPQGPAGATGPTGAAGPQGPQGLKGDTGAIGAVGPQGPAGPTGPQGPAGVAGPQGTAGSPGPVGAVGPQGPAGASPCTLNADGSIACNGNMGVSGTVTAAGLSTSIPNSEFVGIDPANGVISSGNNGSVKGYFENNHNTSGNDALTARHTGFGNAIHGINTQVSGRAGYFETTHGQSSSSTLEAKSLGPGPAFQAENVGTGPAAVFPSGKVGIGTSTPAATLDVNGGVAIAGNTVINSSGQWVGATSGLQGPAGPTGPAGPQGLAGPIGPAGPAGPQGPAGSQGPAGISTLFTTGTASAYTTDSSWILLGTLNLPAGLYLISAKLTIAAANNPQYANGVCVLTRDSTDPNWNFDYASATLQTNAAATLVLSDAVNYASDTVIRMYCAVGQSNNGGNMYSIRLHAAQVGGLKIQ